MQSSALSRFGMVLAGAIEEVADGAVQTFFDDESYLAVSKIAHQHVEVLRGEFLSVQAAKLYFEILFAQLV